MSTEEMKGKNFTLLTFLKVDQNGDELKQITQEREDGYKPISSKEENVNEDSKNDSFDFGVSQYIQNENTLTPRALISGILIGVLIAIMNVNFGLKTGWTQGENVIFLLLQVEAFSQL
jgi:F0F1-type ATP synthase assembly protein I